MKGVAYTSDLFSGLSCATDGCATRHLRHPNGSRWELWGKWSRDVTPRVRFNCSFSESYAYLLCLWKQPGAETTKLMIPIRWVTPGKGWRGWLSTEDASKLLLAAYTSGAAMGPSK